MPVTIDISGHYKGDTWLGLSGSLTMNGAPLDLTDASARMQIRKDKAWPTYAKEWSSASGTISFPEPTSGSFLISSGTIEVDAYTYYYDIEFTLNNGQVVTMFDGTWPINQDVTR